MLLSNTIREECYRQLAVLENMFADVGLVNLAESCPHHPAVQQYHQLNDFVRSGVTYPDEVEVLREITSALLDRSVWAVVPSATDYWAFIPNVNARKRVRENIRDPDQFHDTVAEVFFWSWLHEQTQAAELQEEAGLPDIVIAPGSQTEVWAEVKRIRLGKNPVRMGEVIGKANRQIKNAQAEKAGVVFLSIERAVQRVALDDEIPNDILPYITEVERRLGSGFNRSAGRVIISWDDFVIDTEPGRGITYAFRRRSVTREHRQPRAEVWLPPNVTHVERTINISVDWPKEAEEKRTGHGQRLGLGSAVVGPDFREFNASWDGIRPQHALEAFHQPDAVFRYQFCFGDGEQLLITRRVKVARQQFTMLLVVHPLADGRHEINNAYRLYDDKDTHEGLHHHPMAAFEVLVSRYGVPFSFPSPSGEVMIKFLKAARLALPIASPNALFRLLGLPEGVDALSSAARIRMVQAATPTFEIEWLWFLHEKRYRAEIRKYLR